MSYNDSYGYGGVYASDAFPFLDPPPGEGDISNPAQQGHVSQFSGNNNTSEQFEPSFEGSSAQKFGRSGQRFAGNDDSYSTHAFSDNVQFQIPDFVYSNTPNLATGGGVEVFPFGMPPVHGWMAGVGGRRWQDEDGLKKQTLHVQVEKQQPEPEATHGLVKPHARRPSLHHELDLELDVEQQQQRRHSYQQEAQQGQAHVRPEAQSQNARMLEEAPISDPLGGAIAASLPPPIPPPSSAAASASLKAPNSTGTTAATALTNTTALVASATQSTLGLPIYSATGFDLLSILGRVATRPNPRIKLGPVDMTCSFVVTDTRRHDHPIVYCSPNFMKLSGYDESEVLGRNCRFLQSPRGVMAAGEQRPDAPSHGAATQLKKCLEADKEVQVVITNYRKDGTAFPNLVTVIPILGGVSGGTEENDVVFQVGFQVDLTEQPTMIIENLKNGSYMVDYSTQSLYQPPLKNPGSGANGGVGTRERRATVIPKITISKEMKRLLNDPGFVRSIPITTTTNHPPQPLLPPSGNASTAAVPSEDIYGGNHPLHFMLLEMGPDFVHVVSLKGTFLYVAPSVRNVLGYEPEDLAGKSLSDLAHPEDVVPLMRELKESSTTGISATGPAEGTTGTSTGTSTANAAATVALATGHPVQPRTVDLLFRARTKNGAYVWVESRGRLHVEPGKGRKAIILSGRAKEIPKLSWGAVARGGGIAKSVKRRVPVSTLNPNVFNPPNGYPQPQEFEEIEVQREFWATISPSMVCLMLGRGFSDVLGWTQEEWRGKNMKRLFGDGGANVEEVVERLVGREWRLNYDYGDSSHEDLDYQDEPDLSEQLIQTRTHMLHKDGRAVDVVLNVYRCERDPLVVGSMNAGGVTPAPLIVQVRLVGAECWPLVPDLPHSHSSSSSRHSPTEHCRQSSVSSRASPSEHWSSSSTDLAANMFEELEISRGSSWQYELQQLKYANQRLRDDIMVLEAAVKATSSIRSPSMTAGSLDALSSAGPSGSGASGNSGRPLYSSASRSGGVHLPEPWSTSGLHSPGSATAGYFASAALPARTSRGGPSSSSQQQQQHHSLQLQNDQNHPQHEQHRYQHPQHGQDTQHGQEQQQGHAQGRTLPPLPEWPASAGLGQSPFVQRIHQEAMSSLNTRPGYPLKRAWGAPDGPSR